MKKNKNQAPTLYTSSCSQSPLLSLPLSHPSSLPPSICIRSCVQHIGFTSLTQPMPPTQFPCLLQKHPTLLGKPSLISKKAFGNLHSISCLVFSYLWHQGRAQPLPQPGTVVVPLHIPAQLLQHCPDANDCPCLEGLSSSWRQSTTNLPLFPSSWPHHLPESVVSVHQGLLPWLGFLECCLQLHPAHLAHCRSPVSSALGFSNLLILHVYFHYLFPNHLWSSSSFSPTTSSSSYLLHQDFTNNCPLFCTAPEVSLQLDNSSEI